MECCYSSVCLLIVMKGCLGEICKLVFVFCCDIEIVRLLINRLCCLFRFYVLLLWLVGFVFVSDVVIVIMLVEGWNISWVLSFIGVKLVCFGISV